MGNQISEPQINRHKYISHYKVDRHLKMLDVNIIKLQELLSCSESTNHFTRICEIMGKINLVINECLTIINDYIFCKPELYEKYIQNIYNEVYKIDSLYLSLMPYSNPDSRYDNNNPELFTQFYKFRELYSNIKVKLSMRF